LITLGASPALSAGWFTCDGHPVRVKYPPMGMSWDECSIPSASPQERAFFSALYETRLYVNALGFGAAFQRIHNGQCIIEHDNARSDAGLVNRADIDGNLGVTIEEDDDCEFIVQADVLVGGDLNFERADESTTIRGDVPAGTRIGALVMLHELGHALGLDHSSDFAVMRAGIPAGMPFVGMLPNSGGLSSELTGDDVLGISNIYGFDPSYRNVYVSSQVLHTSGRGLFDNWLEPNPGGRMRASRSVPLLVCPGDQVKFFASVGNDSSVREQFQVALYADADPNAYFFPATGALATYNVSMGRGHSSFPVEFTVPASLPSNVTQFMFVSISSTLQWDRKGYDNSARSRLQIRRKPSC
jgi:hypothetical protein